MPKTVMLTEVKVYVYDHDDDDDETVGEFAVASLEGELLARDSVMIAGVEGVADVSDGER